MEVPGSMTRRRALGALLLGCLSFARTTPPYPPEAVALPRRLGQLGLVPERRPEGQGLAQQRLDRRVLAAVAVEDESRERQALSTLGELVGPVDGLVIALGTHLLFVGTHLWCHLLQRIRGQWVNPQFLRRSLQVRQAVWFIQAEFERILDVLLCRLLIDRGALLRLRRSLPAARAE